MNCEISGKKERKIPCCNVADVKCSYLELTVRAHFIPAISQLNVLCSSTGRLQGLCQLFARVDV